jgi:hypothetical protein
MVKAIKRKPQAFKSAEERAKEKENKRTKKIRLFTLVILVLMVMGWAIGGYLGLGNKDNAQQQNTQGQGGYGAGTLSGQQSARVGDYTDAYGIYGQLDDPPGLAGRLPGDLYALDRYSQLILTNATEDAIRLNSPGNYILYRVASCGEFDCLIDSQTAAGLNSSSTVVFDVYQLNRTSQYLATQKVGLPSAASQVQL